MSIKHRSGGKERGQPLWLHSAGSPLAEGEILRMMPGLRFENSVVGWAGVEPLAG